MSKIRCGTALREGEGPFLARVVETETVDLRRREPTCGGRLGVRSGGHEAGSRVPGGENHIETGTCDWSWGLEGHLSGCRCVELGYLVTSQLECPLNLWTW
jgi:hypothetical protein